MKLFDIFRGSLTNEGSLEKVGVVSAIDGENALRIAKQKGHIHPIVGENLRGAMTAAEVAALQNRTRIRQAKAFSAMKDMGKSLLSVPVTRRTRDE